jgi:hypothetical protein
MKQQHTPAELSCLIVAFYYEILVCDARSLCTNHLQLYFHAFAKIFEVSQNFKLQLATTMSRFRSRGIHVETLHCNLIRSMRRSYY